MSTGLKIVVCGAGAWGTAMAIHWARQGAQTVIVPRRGEQATQLETERENCDYLKGYSLPDALEVSGDLDTSLGEADAIFLGVPSYALRDWCGRIKNVVTFVEGRSFLISLAKGLEMESRMTPCEILKDVFPDALVGSLSGPTFAGEVAAGNPAAMTLAVVEDAPIASRIQSAASGANMRIYLSHDLRGVELGGCMKNVYAVAAGCCQGLGLGDNALAALLTRALAEMKRVGRSLGANQETFYGLSGFGDLVATCHGQWSRNRTFGEEIARSGRSAADIIASQKTAVEGYRTAKSFHEECRDKGIDAPILEQVYRILYKGKSPKEALIDLMNRDLKRE